MSRARACSPLREKRDEIGFQRPLTDASHPLIWGFGNLDRARWDDSSFPMPSDHPEPGSPQTILFARFRRRLAQIPFEPFRVVTTSGRVYDVPTADHAGVVPILRIIQIADDRCNSVEIHALHIAAIESLRKRRKAA